MNAEPSRVSRLVYGALGGLSILAAWQIATDGFGAPEYVLPRPTSVARIFAQKGDLLLHNFFPTALEAGLGFFAGNLAAIAVAALFVYRRRLELAYFPVILVFNTIPIVALSPILIIAFGLGTLPKALIAAIICFFPTLVNMTRGLQTETDSERELMRVLSATSWQHFWRLKAPRSLPFLFASLRIASTSSVIGAIVGEWIGANAGLGALILQSTFSYQSDLLYAAIALSSGLALALFSVVVGLEGYILRYRR